jgi:hypothetical protein
LLASLAAKGLEHFVTMVEEQHLTRTDDACEQNARPLSGSLRSLQRAGRRG